MFANGLIDIADQHTTVLRFAPGDRVLCQCGTWHPGTIVKLFYTQRNFPPGKCVPYQVRLDDGRLIFTPSDSDGVIRVLESEQVARELEQHYRSLAGEDSEEEEEEDEGMGGTTGTETLRFAVGTQVEVRISARSEPGVRVDMISVLTCDGGRWVSARVCAQHYRQDDWCPGFHCAYTVHVEGDVTDDGVRIVSAVREDDDRCIRRAPPKEPPQTGEPWDPRKGVEAAYDLLVEKGLATDAQTDAVARAGGGRAAVALMLDQILSIASHAVGDHPLVGKRVRVDGLTASPALNGKLGIVRGWVDESQRYRVELDGGRSICARAPNLYNLVEEFDCPICMEVSLIDPKGPVQRTNAVVLCCCGKCVCGGCHDKLVLQGVREHDEFPPCPFCRQPTGSLHSRKGDHAIDRHGLQRRAAQGDPVAQYNLSGQYDNPDCGLPRDYQASAAWAALAAMGGHVRGYNNLAYAILTGEGVPADARRAHPWFRRGAELGHISCVWANGVICRDGYAVSGSLNGRDMRPSANGEGVDRAEAERWLARGEREGDSASMRDLMVLQGVPRGEIMARMMGAMMGVRR